MTIKEAIENSKSMAEAAKKLNMPFTTFKRKAGNLYKPNQGGKGIKNSNYEGYDFAPSAFQKFNHP